MPIMYTTHFEFLHAFSYCLSNPCCMHAYFSMPLVADPHFLPRRVALFLQTFTCVSAHWNRLSKLCCRAIFTTCLTACRGNFLEDARPQAESGCTRFRTHISFPRLTHFLAMMPCAVCCTRSAREPLCVCDSPPVSRSVLRLTTCELFCVTTPHYLRRLLFFFIFCLGGSGDGAPVPVRLLLPSHPADAS